MPKIGERFNPRKMFDGIFIVAPVAQYRGISPGAKMVWGRLYRYSGDRGEIYPAVKTIAVELGMSDSQARRYLHELVEQNFLEVEADPGRSNDYFFLWHPAFAGEIGEYRMSPPLSDATGVSKNRPLSDATGVTPVGCYSTPLSDATDEVLIVNTDVRKTETPIVPFSDQTLPEASLEPESPEPSTPTLPSPSERFESQSTSYDLQLDENTDKFVANAYRQSRGAKITKAEIKRYADKIASTEDSLSREEFRTQLWNYLYTPSKWLRENKWPIAAFLKNPLDYTAPVMAYQASRDASPAPACGRTSYDTLASAPVQSVTEKNVPVYLQYVNQWNTLVPELICGELPGFVVRQIEKAIQDPEFAAVFGEVAEKCSKIARADFMPGISFNWLFTSTKDGPTWQSIYMGKYDWAMRSRSSAQMSASDQAMAAAERADREAEVERVKGNIK